MAKSRFKYINGKHVRKAFKFHHFYGTITNYSANFLQSAFATSGDLIELERNCNIKTAVCCIISHTFISATHFIFCLLR